MVGFQGEGGFLTTYIIQVFEGGVKWFDRGDYRKIDVRQKNKKKSPYTAENMV